MNLLLYTSDLVKIPYLLQTGESIAEKVGAERKILLVIAPGAEKLAEGYRHHTADEIIAVELAEELRFPETVSIVIDQVIEKNSIGYLAMIHSPFEVEVAARVGTKREASCITNCLAVKRENNNTVIAERMLYGGVVTGVFELKLPAVLTLHENGCRNKSVENPEHSAKLVVETIEPELSHKKILEKRAIEKAVDLKGAERIVSIGRGLSKKEDLTLIEDLAHALQAQLGCSRPLVEDYKWLKLERQVGLTGTTVAPKLYLAIGISGQIQHVVGMKDAQVVVAINNNKNAPIFEVADYGIVGDLYEVVPQLLELMNSLPLRS